MKSDTDTDQPSEDTRDHYGIDAIERLADLMRTHGLEEIDVIEHRGRHWKSRIRISKNSALRSAPTVHVPPAAPNPIPAPASAPEPEQGDSVDANDPANHPGVVLSPMVGTVYLQPQPGEPKFIEIGSSVQVGQTLLIIEAMKTMNQIHATHEGTVRRILVEDTSIVEYGTPLVVID